MASPKVGVSKRWRRASTLGSWHGALPAEGEDLEARLADLEEARYLRGEFGGDEGADRYARLYSGISARLEGKRSPLKEVTRKDPDIGAVLDPVEVLESWTELSLDARRAAVAVVIEEVEVRKADRMGQRFDGEARLSIRWMPEVGGYRPAPQRGLSSMIARVRTTSTAA